MTTSRTAQIALEAKQRIGDYRFVDKCSDAIEIRLRCFWLFATPGSGFLRVSVPTSLKLSSLLDEYCVVMHLPRSKVRLVEINLVEAVQFALDKRFQQDTDSHLNMENMPGIRSLNLDSTIAAAKISAESTLDILYIVSSQDELEVRKKSSLGCRKLF